MRIFECRRIASQIGPRRIGDRFLGERPMTIRHIVQKFHLWCFLRKQAQQIKILLCFTLVSINVLSHAEEGEVPEAPDAIGGVVRYVELKPTFIANFGVSDKGAMRYVRADVTVRVSNKEAEYAARYHAPALRNSIVLLLSRQDESTVASSTGRETLKAEALTEIRQLLELEEGESHIEDLMFTNFVVQR